MKTRIAEPAELAPIVAEVNRLLQRRLRGFAIEESDEGLVLSGEAPSYYVKQLAQQIVNKLAEQPIARNRINAQYDPVSMARSLRR